MYIYINYVKGVIQNKNQFFLCLKSIKKIDFYYSCYYLNNNKNIKNHITNAKFLYKYSI
jgi:hypothetical protein